MPDKENEGPFVFMVHKDFKDRAPARVLRTTFEKRWKEKGWTEVKSDKPVSATSASPTPPDTTSATGGKDDK